MQPVIELGRGLRDAIQHQGVKRMSEEEFYLEFMALFRDQGSAAVVKRIVELGKPTNDAAAAGFWRFSNKAPVEDASDIMLVAGYEPFCGFPLTHRKPLVAPPSQLVQFAYP
jgi:hypothetical protein